MLVEVNPAASSCGANAATTVFRYGMMCCQLGHPCKPIMDFHSCLTPLQKSNMEISLDSYIILCHIIPSAVCLTMMPPTYHLPSPGRSSKQAWSLVRKGLGRHEVVGGLYTNAHIDLVRTVGQLDLLPKLLELGNRSKKAFPAFR